ncbi:MAG: hypothetical protein MZW92_70480 [Comamonadaceae bacterium]|nr:hypothetical protein [Comamonadaceae bacterium]
MLAVAAGGAARLCRAHEPRRACRRALNRAGRTSATRCPVRSSRWAC